MTVLKHILVYIFQKAVRGYGVNALVENKTDDFPKRNIKSAEGYSFGKINLLKVLCYV